MEIEKVETIYTTKISLRELRDMQACISMLDSRGWFNNDKLAKRCIKLSSDIEFEIKQTR